MTTVFRNADSRFPPLWESDVQPPSRWHGTGEGPAQYVADTPDGAWAEFLRHEEITDPADLAGVARSLWAFEVDDDELAGASPMTAEGLLGGEETYPACQELAREARASGATSIRAPSAALLPGAACGERTEGGGLMPAPDRDGVVYVLYGRRPDLRGWLVVDAGRPPVRVLGLVRPMKLSEDR
jgi:RES domain